MRTSCIEYCPSQGCIQQYTQTINERLRLPQGARRNLFCFSFSLPFLLTFLAPLLCTSAHCRQLQRLQRPEELTRFISKAIRIGPVFPACCRRPFFSQHTSPSRFGLARLTCAHTNIFQSQMPHPRQQRQEQEQQHRIEGKYG